MKRIFCATVLIVSAIAANAGLTDTLTVKSVKVAGPYSTKDVMFTTRANAEGRDYDGKDVAWDTEMNLNLWKASGAKSLPAVITDSSVITIKGKGIYQLGFTVQNTRYQKMSFRISSKGRNSLYVDETKRDNNVALSAGRHECVVKLQETGDDADTVRIQVLVERIDSLKGCYTEVNPTGRRYYSFEDQMSNEHIGRTRISATGRYVYQQKYITKLDGNNDWTKEIIDTRTGIMQMTSSNGLPRMTDILRQAGTGRITLYINIRMCRAGDAQHYSHTPERTMYNSVPETQRCW